MSNKNLQQSNRPQSLWFTPHFVQILQLAYLIIGYFTFRSQFIQFLLYLLLHLRVSGYGICCKAHSVGYCFISIEEKQQALKIWKYRSLYEMAQLVVESKIIIVCVRSTRAMFLTSLVLDWFSLLLIRELSLIHPKPCMFSCRTCDLKIIFLIMGT